MLKKLQQESPERILVIRPQGWPPAGQITRKRSKIVQTIEIGYKEVIKNQKQIKDFLDLGL
jgi:hypothetical protein